MTISFIPINNYEIIIVAFKIPFEDPPVKDSNCGCDMEPLRFPPPSQLTGRTSRVIKL